MYESSHIPTTLIGKMRCDPRSGGSFLSETLLTLKIKIWNVWTSHAVFWGNTWTEEHMCTKADSWCEPVRRLKSYERNKCNSQRYGFMTLTNLGASQEFPLFAPGASFRSCFPKKERIHAYKCFADNTRELRPISETNTWKPVCWYNERETFFCRGHWKHIQHFASRGNEEAEMY